ncbi:type II toxin-antitoxin system RatA family toxin, partial [Methylobrevis pamukkalensis]|uniref:type II toxin-antitoxin system RatA family toxin n=1 Tax=Methylobrevis pamukkalensis TaxID=1439726 RepID=UPI000845E6ED
MPQFETKHRVAHTAQEMFDLVADVDRYPEFVPMCESLRVRYRKTTGEGQEVLVADMAVGYKLVRETFTSKVTLDRPAGLILVEYIDGPFRFLQNRWTFRELDETSCEVGFFISYEFKSRTLGALMGAMFDHAFRRFTTAFEARADKIYG